MGRSTTRHNADGSKTLYLHVFKSPDGGKLTVKSLKSRPEKATILGQDNPLTISGKEGAWAIQLPDGPLSPFATVVALTFKDQPIVE